MFEISNISEVREAKKLETENYKEIKPESEISYQDAKNFWNALFEAMEGEKNKNEVIENDNFEGDLEKTLNDYFKDLQHKSESPETLPEKPFDALDLKKLTPEENAEMRDEFDDKKTQLKKEWEDDNGRTWPKYDHDVYSSNGKLIRKAGTDYDAHHIQPLGMGGKNEAGNITPLNAEVHYDKQGVHAPDSPYSKLDQMLGGMN